MYCYHTTFPHSLLYNSHRLSFNNRGRGFYSLLIDGRVTSHGVRTLYLANTFKFVTASILFRRWKQMIITRHQMKTVYRMFEHCSVKNL